MSMLLFIIKRLLALLLLTFILITAAFVAFGIMPTDPTVVTVSRGLSPEMKQAIAERESHKSHIPGGCSVLKLRRFFPNLSHDEGCNGKDSNTKDRPPQPLPQCSECACTQLAEQISPHEICPQDVLAGRT